MKKSKIQWTVYTWNPWQGCRKVSPGCKYCYMYRDKAIYGQNAKTVVRSKTVFNAPLKWKNGELIFTCSWSDWFIEEADEWRDEAWEIIKNTPHHTYQILTKRPERIKEHLPEYFNSLSNVWIGVSIETEEQMGRLEYLKDLSCTTFASFEPLIGPIKWDNRMNDLKWCIIGGESGNDIGKYRYRKMELDWMLDLIDGAKSSGVPCFVKQLGTYQYKQLALTDRHGGNVEELPEEFKLRQFPRVYYDKHMAII
jgi:protein gp37